MKMTMAALLLALATLPALAQSDAPATKIHDYTYLDVAYHIWDIDNLDENARGAGVAGGMQINDWSHLWLSVSSSRIELEYVHVTSRIVGIGVGIHTPWTDSVSTYTNVGYVTAEVETEWGVARDVTASIATDGNGYALGAGIRALVLPELELSAGISLISIEDESDTSWGGGFAYSITNKVALGVSLSVTDDAIGAGIGMRYYFQ